MYTDTLYIHEHFCIISPQFQYLIVCVSMHTDLAFPTHYFLLIVKSYFSNIHLLVDEMM